MKHYLRCLALGAMVLSAGSVSAQTARTGRLMREKLQHSQRVLQAVTTSDWALLQRETQALTGVTKSPAWTELMKPELRPFADEFQKALADLSAAADHRDYDGAGRSYLELTGACLSCHKHVMKSRIASAK